MQSNCRSTLRLFFIALTFLGIIPDAPAGEKGNRPNIILILADDLGYGDLSSYGATDIETPSIDRIGLEGVRFINHYTPANTCSPTRAAMLTGRYQARTGVNAVIMYDSLEGLPLEEVTMAEMLRDSGYVTGMIGKWHLGAVSEYMPWNQGFDEYFGVANSNDDKNFFLYESKGKSHRRFPEAVDQSHLTQQYNRRALQFIDTHAGGSQPFFLYIAHNVPHVPLHPHPNFVNKSKRGVFGDVVMELDDSVGQVLNKLEELDLADNTLVLFTSDNGGWRAMRDKGGDNGDLREGKLTSFDGGHKVPALVRWPQTIFAGGINKDVATVMDWFVTFAHYARAKVPNDREIDGKNLAVVLENTGKRVEEPMYYFALRPPHEDQHHLLSAVREGKWKYKIAQRGYYPKILEPLMKVGLYSHGELLFDLVADPGETHNIIDEYPEVANQMRRLITEFDSNNSFRQPILVQATEEDDAGWEALWRGIALAIAASVSTLCVIVYGFYVLVGKLLRGYRDSTKGRYSEK